ncbi:MAG: HAMP domain-containing protein [Actinobacteria bacterium]|jgi:signal transduction histidine kinase/CHASE3 domain sensor protein|nr:MAG: HAMP domain-containing protein [Actinomycetota bacterium]
MSIRAKLIFGFGVTGSILLAFMVAILWTNANLNVYRERRAYALEQLEQAFLCREAVIVQIDEARRIFLSTGSREEYESAREEARGVFTAWRNLIEQDGGSETMSDLATLQQLEQIYGDINGYLAQAISLYGQGEQEEAIAVLAGSSEEDFEGRFLPASQEIISSGSERASLYKQKVYDASQTAGIVAVVLLAFGLAIAVTVPVVIVREIARSFNKMGKAAERVGRGDFGARVGIEKDGEFMALAEVFNGMAENLERSEGRLRKLNNLFLSLGADIIDNIEAIIDIGKDILGAEMMEYCRIQGGMLTCLFSVNGNTGFEVTKNPREYMAFRVIEAEVEERLNFERLEDAPGGRECVEARKFGMRSFAGYPVAVAAQGVVASLCVLDSAPRDFNEDEIDLLGNLARVLSIEEERLSREEGLKDFIDIASHEIRHPITILKGYAITLKERWDRLDEERIKEILHAMDSGADRLNRLADALLDVSRIERGRFTVHKREVFLGELIEQAVVDMRHKGAKNDFRVSAAGGGDTAWVDPDKTLELLTILLDNAVEFSPLDSRIDIEVEIREHEVVVCVGDRGQGIGAGDLERIFERFYQVEDALHHSKPGMGMGLYIAREIATAHGGRIWCERREGGGSSFVFSFPV